MTSVREMRTSSDQYYCECPFCRHPVPPEIIQLRGSFRCPNCSKSLKVHRGYALAVSLAAVLGGLILAYVSGLHDFFFLCVGLGVSPLLVTPIWRAMCAVRMPRLVLSNPEITTMNL